MIAFLWAIFILCFCILGRIGFGTFIVDPFTLVVPGYVVTYLVYGVLPQWMRKGAIGKFWILTFPLTIIGLSIGAWLPYFNVIPSDQVYGGFLPQSFVGPLQGNDFMWNGLGLMHIFGRVVPESLTPTYQYFWFNLLAVLIWLSYPILLGWGVIAGNQMVLNKPTFGEWFRGLLRVTCVGLGFSILNAALAALVSAYYIHY